MPTQRGTYAKCKESFDIKMNRRSRCKRVNVRRRSRWTRWLTVQIYGNTNRNFKDSNWRILHLNNKISCCLKSQRCRYTRSMTDSHKFWAARKFKTLITTKVVRLLKTTLLCRYTQNQRDFAKSMLSIPQSKTTGSPKATNKFQFS